MLILLLLWPVPGQSQSVSVFPTGAGVAITQPTAVKLQWIVRNRGRGKATSVQGLFPPTPECTGSILGTVSTPLQGTVRDGVGRVPETLTIRQDVTRRAKARGLPPFFDCPRQF